MKSSPLLWFYGNFSTIINKGAVMKNKKYIISVILAFILALTPVLSQEIKNIQDKTVLFTDSIAKALPLHTTIGLNWSDAYIGQLLGFPPHFGAGVVAGFTTMDFTPVTGLLEAFNISLPFGSNDILKNMGMPLPGYAAEGRIGGFILPFDIGIKAGYLPENMIADIIDEFNFSLKYMLFGADFRYSLINKKVLPLRISAGFGVNYLEGGLGAALPAGSTFTFSDPENNNYTVNSSDINAGLEWRAISAELKAQISFPMTFLTPYAGAGVIYAWSQTGYRLKSDITVTDSGGSPVSLEDAENILKEYGITGVSDKGFETIKSSHSFGARVFAGASVNLWFIRIDVTAMYEFLSGNLGGTFGLRFQL